ncbi:MAG: RNA polymerase sigma factor [Pseudomonadota bacterium]
MTSRSHEASVERLYLEHRFAIRRFLFRMLRCEDAAAEVTQEAFLRLLRLGPRDGIRDARAYLFQIAANAARDRLKQDRRQVAIREDRTRTDSIRLAEPSAEASAIGQERLRLIARTVDDLPPRCRQVFLMSRMDGLSNTDIAKRLGISRNAVEKHIIKAMLRCRRRLQMAEQTEDKEAL